MALIRWYTFFFSLLFCRWVGGNLLTGCFSYLFSFFLFLRFHNFKRVRQTGGSAGGEGGSASLYILSNQRENNKNLKSQLWCNGHVCCRKVWARWPIGQGERWVWRPCKHLHKHGGPGQVLSSLLAVECHLKPPFTFCFFAFLELSNWSRHLEANVNGFVSCCVLLTIRWRVSLALIKHESGLTSLWWQERGE
jgi:hypothetical protein